MSSLEYRKEFKIEYKVFKEGDIWAIARLFKEQFQDRDYKREIALNFDDNSRISGDDIDIFETDEFKRRICRSIHFTYRAHSYDRCLNVSLHNTTCEDYKSNMEVTSTDKIWYDSINNQLNTLLSEIEPQKKIEVVKNALQGGLSIIESYLLCFSLTRIFPQTFTPIGVVLLSACATSIFLFLNSALLTPLKKAYPKVEFAFGPEHLNVSKKFQKAIGVVVPFIIDIILFVLGIIMG